MQKLRISFLVLVHVLILSHIYIFGDEIIGSVDFQEFFHSFIKYGIINSGVILVLLAFIITLVFGRFFCGWACHFGAIQELSWIILQKLNIKPVTINSRLIFFLPLFVLLNFYVVPNIMYAFNNPWSGISVELGEPEIWAFLPGITIAILTFFIDGFLIVYFLGRKGFCRFVCPWGAFLKIPNSFAMFKVRKTGTCTECNDCTNACPVGIDVSHEINTYDKVLNTNCTSCMICTSGCPSNALSYSFKSPVKENFSFRDFLYDRKSYTSQRIKDSFESVRSKDVVILPFAIAMGFAIDELYGMGHMMAYGIAAISAIIIFRPFKYKTVKAFTLFSILLFFTWHGAIKYSIWQGLSFYRDHKYEKSIPHLERVVDMYPKSDARFHYFLGEMYLEMDDFDRAYIHAVKASQIEPDQSSPHDLIRRIDSSRESG